MAAAKLGAAEIMQMASGFWVSKTLFSGVELGVFDLLAKAPASAAQLAADCGAHPDALERLMIALTALGLLNKDGDKFSNSAAARAYLVKGSIGYIAGNFGHFNNDLYPLWQHLPDAVRQNSSRWQQAFGDQMSHNPFEAMYQDAARLRDFLTAMNSMSTGAALELLDHFDFSPYKSMLDVGGALGTLAMAAISRQPQMRAIIFDLPPVGPLAQEFLASQGLQDRIEVKTGDMFTDPLPEGADLLTLSWILHDWDDQHCVNLLKNCYQALPAGATIMILEKLLDDDKSGPVTAALMSLNMLVATVGGRERTAAEYGKLLGEAGFVDPKPHRLPGIRDYLLARKPV